MEIVKELILLKNRQFVSRAHLNCKSVTSLIRDVRFTRLDRNKQEISLIELLEMFVTRKYILIEYSLINFK